MELKISDWESISRRVGWINMVSGEPRIDFDNLLEFRCSSSGNCCGQLEIYLTDLDIIRIESQGYQLDQFLETLTPEIRIPQNSHTKPVKYYKIKKRPFDRQCVFLEDRLCKIHSFKPYSCRVFPFTMKVINPYELEVYLHPLNICGSVRTGNRKKNDNRMWLNYLMDEEKREIEERKAYDAELRD